MQKKSDLLNEKAKGNESEPLSSISNSNFALNDKHISFPLSLKSCIVVFSIDGESSKNHEIKKLT